VQGIESKLVLSEVLTKRIQVVFGLVAASVGLISIIALLGGFFSIVIWLIVGLIAGAMARIVMPSKDPMSLLSTMLLGIVGSILGGVVSMLLWRPDGQVFMNRGGIVLSVIGAVILVFLWHRLHPGTQRP
jgi:uncharacterized membrane protein YeaQ/YmgE (transglycosylase-associated protein family)